MRICVACGASERYRPGEWSLGRFRCALFEGKRRVVEGDVCPSCKGRTEEIKRVDSAQPRETK